MVRRLYAAQLPAANTELTLDEESRHHAQVLRLSPGDALRLFDAAGREADARVLRCDRRSLVCEVAAAESIARPAYAVHLAVCVPKAAKLELIVRMATELGVESLQLVHSERSVPKWGADDPKHERLRRIAVEACAQSEQAYAPAVSGPLPLAAALSAAPSDALKCAFIERDVGATLPNPLTGQPHAAWALVGAEGGFARDEVALIDRSGALMVSLGRSILRVETACVVACALLLDRMRGSP
jgi:16S rRNA (uracil1498-N3)-methyltransferase